MAGLRAVRQLLEAHQRAEERKLLEAADNALLQIVSTGGGPGGAGSPPPGGAGGGAPTSMSEDVAADASHAVAQAREELVGNIIAALKLALPKRAQFTTPGLWPTWASFEVQAHSSCVPCIGLTRRGDGLDG